MQEPFDEQRIIRLVLSGDEGACRQLIRQYEGLVLHIVTPLIGVNADREDLCQDIFVRVYEKLHTFQHRSKLSTWIGQIAHNMCLNWLKKKKNINMSDLSTAAEMQLLAIPSEATHVEELMIHDEQLGRLKQCIELLTPLQQTTILLFYHDELNLEDISQITCLPVNTVKSHLFRAKSSLKKLLTQPDLHYGKANA